MGSGGKNCFQSQVEGIRTIQIKTPRTMGAKEPLKNGGRGLKKSRELHRGGIGEESVQIRLPRTRKKEGFGSIFFKISKKNLKTRRPEKNRRCQKTVGGRRQSWGAETKTYPQKWRNNRA